MLDFIKVYCDPGPGHDGQSCILCEECADLLLYEDSTLVSEFGEPMDWERYHPEYDMPSEVFCDYCDACMDDEDSNASEDAACGDSCGDEPHGCLECDENPACMRAQCESSMEARQ